MAEKIEKTFHSITLPGQDTARVPLTAAEFSPSAAYKVRDYCTYRGKLYRCTTAHAAGVWNDTHFTATDIDAEFDRKLDIPASQASAPANPRVGDLWIDNDENSPIYNVDASPTLNSTNAVQSGGTKVALNSLDSRKMEHGVITGDFSASVDYRVGDLVFYATTANGITTRTLYRCTTNHNSAAWNAAHFTATTLEVELQRIRESGADTDMIGDLFGAKSTYAVGDYCIYNDNLYRCIRAIDNSSTSTPAFDPNDWSEVKLADEVSDLKSAISNITGNVAFATWIDGYIRCGDATVDINDIRSGQYKHQIIDCSGGDVFTISGQSYGTVARLWCFISADGTNLLAETANATVNDKIITAPSNTAKLIINWSYVSYGTPDNIVTIYGGKLIKNTVSENTEQIDIMKTYYENGNLFDRSKAHDGYVINVSGTEEAFREACSSDYINLKAGTYCYQTATTIYGANAKYVPTYTQANAFVSNVEGSLDGNIVTFTLSADSRIKLKLASATYRQAMLVNGNVYPETYIPYIDGVWLSDNVKVKAENIIPEIVGNNQLYGKKVVFDGDSICHGTSVGQSSPYYGWGYAGRIGTANDMDWHNVAQSGATITHGLKFSNNTDRHWISSYIDTIYANYPDADYIILEGGTNDADLLYQDAEKTGEVSQTAFSNFDYDTYAGALDYLFYNAINKFPNAKIGFVVAQKMGITSRYDSQFFRRRFFDMAIETCKKWSIPYIDLWNESGLHPKVPSQYTAGASTNLYTDGQHLTDAGYDMISPKIEAWMKTL